VVVSCHEYLEDLAGKWVLTVGRVVQEEEPVHRIQKKFEILWLRREVETGFIFFLARNAGGWVNKLFDHTNTAMLLRLLTPTSAPRKSPVAV